MKINKILSLVLGLSVLATSCTLNEIPEQNLPADEFIRLTLSGGDGTTATPAQATRATWEDPNGKGSLGFKWEEVAIDSDETDELLVIISNGDEALVNKETPEATGDGLTYTGMAVTPNGENQHLAGFETVRYYSTGDLNNAKYVYAVAGGADISVDAEAKKHVCNLQMPSTFVQGEDQNPSFLRDHMYMYASAAYNVGSSTRLKFNHIPATFRFIITNGTENDMTFESVSVSVVGGGAVASKTADVTFGWAADNAELSFGAETYEAVMTMLPDNGVTVLKGQKYTTYSMALPLADSDAFAGKALNFAAKCSDGKELTFLLDGESLANANGSGSGIYNWVGGKSYTIKFNIGEGGRTTGVMLSNKDITVASTVGGEFTLKYVDAAGNPLADYADICTMTVDDMAIYEDFVDANVAPFEADAIGIFDEAGVKVGSIEISAVRADDASLLYSVGMLSDVHVGVDTAVDDFANALNFFNSTVNAEFICICGDITENATEAEYTNYKAIVDANSPSRPVYTTTGNHDAKGDGVNETLWRQYTGQNLTFEVSRILPNGKTDHYLFLGMSYWNFTSAYLESNIKWLENKLEEYRNERCFVITHLFFPDRAGNMNEVYPSYNWLSGIQLNTLQTMCDRYKNTIWFSGHSHWKWSLQQYDDLANVCRNPESGWSVHIPSCAKPIDSNGATREDKVAQSEGAVINVYENHIDILGVDFISGKYLPIATYRLDTTLQEVEEKEEVVLDETCITASGFVWNPEKGSATTDAGTASVTDVPDMPGYVDVIFTGKSQGYYMTNSTFTPGVASPDQTVDITIEDLQCWTGWGTSTQAEVSTIEKVGFYSGSYNLASTEDCIVYVKTEPGKEGQGVQFQTSSSCAGPYPIKIRMKARAQFHAEGEQKNYISAENFSYNSVKEDGATVTNTDGMANYVDVTFTRKSQGFYITNSTHTSSTRNAIVTIESAQALYDGVEVSMPGKVGFYQDEVNGSSTAYLMENRTITLKDGNGLPFQISSSYSGPYPITIRMKVEVEFY